MFALTVHETVILANFGQILAMKPPFFGKIFKFSLKKKKMLKPEVVSMKPVKNHVVSKKLVKNQIFSYYSDFER